MHIEFISGFEKKAESVAGIGIGATLGSIIGGMYAFKKNKKDIEYLNNKSHAKGVDAKDLFEKIKHKLPKDTLLLTKADIEKVLKKQTDFEKHQLISELRNATEFNAAAFPRSHAENVKKFLPKEWQNRNLILTADKVYPSILLHEAGHIIDFDKVSKKGVLARAASSLRPTYFEETAAWDQAPGQVDKVVQEKALDTYKRSYIPLATAALGAGLGAIVGNAI